MVPKQKRVAFYLVSSAVETETAAAAELLTRQGRKRLKPISFGADKGYNKAFVEFLRRQGIRPDIAQDERRDTPGLDARTTRHESYWISQRKRKRVEEIFGWMKSWGGLRRTRFRGIARVQLELRKLRLRGARGIRTRLWDQSGEEVNCAHTPHIAQSLKRSTGTAIEGRIRAIQDSSSGLQR